MKVKSFNHVHYLWDEAKASEMAGDEVALFIYRSNLLGAVVGGCLEYLSMWTGLRALVVLAAVFYLLSLAFIGRELGEFPGRSGVGVRHGAAKT